MEFYETLDKRRSVRAFQDKAVTKDQLDRIINAVMSCPTAGNLQAYRVMVVRDADRRQALSEAAFGQKDVAEAPVVLVFSACTGDSGTKYGKRGRELYAVQDATIATTFAHLAAAAEGLGSCWIGAFDPAKVSKALDLPKDLLPVAMLPIGHPQKVPGKTTRRPMKDMVTFDDGR